MVTLAVVTEKSHYLVIGLLASGRTILEVSQVRGYSRNWIDRLVRRYNTQAAEAYLRPKKKKSGARIITPRCRPSSIVAASATTSPRWRAMEW
jgi:hypothetical protein